VARRALNFPQALTALIQLKIEDGQELIFDVVRKKWLVCTPEEWVRQHAVQYLVALGYSIHHIQIESGLKTGFNTKRSDIIANSNGKPEVLVECKAPEVALSQKTFNQAFNYNYTIGAPLIWLTNGLQNLYWDCKESKQLEQLPA
tara:strand:- start:7619 stop:8053 length:435 start_codon:yes stop_codon:yes gene_type:complete